MNHEKDLLAEVFDISLGSTEVAQGAPNIASMVIEQLAHLDGGAIRSHVTPVVGLRFDRDDLACMVSGWEGAEFIKVRPRGPRRRPP